MTPSRIKDEKDKYANCQRRDRALKNASFYLPWASVSQHVSHQQYFGIESQAGEVCEPEGRDSDVVF